MAQCEGFDIQLSAYVDGELEGLAVAGVEAHLKECPACAARVTHERRLQAAFRTYLSPDKAPDELRFGVRESLRAAIVRATPPAPRRPARVAQWVALAATIAVAVLTGREWATWSAWGGAAPLESQVLAAHVRSLQVSHLNDVATSDHHTVKPWFAGKLDYSPPVPELDSLGFRLIGGRLDYVLDRPTAAIVYGRRQHLINLFLWPSGESSAAPRLMSDRGYQSVHGAAGGMAYWAVSDLNGQELRQFAQLVAEDVVKK